MKLSIIIPQYKEDEKTIRQLLNSIALQKQIDFKELEVIIVNDHSDYPPPESIIKDYEFKIRIYRLRKNSGVGIARQYGTEKAKGEYLFYLDADDVLISCIALRTIMNYKGDADIIRARFFNENANKTDNGWTWVHSKFYKRKFLKAKGLKFPKELRVNEDAYFNMLAGGLADKIEDSDELVTFWAKNTKSTTRENASRFVVQGFDDFLKGKQLGFRVIKEKGKTELLMANLIDLFVYCYYYFQEIEFYNGNEEVKAKQRKYEKMLAEIIKEFWEEFRTFTETDFDIKLSEVYMSFKDYVNYRLHETFDEYRQRIFEIEV